VNVLSIIRNTRIRERDAKRDAQRRNAAAASRHSWRVKLTARKRRSHINRIRSSFADRDGHGTDGLPDERQRDSIKW